MARKPIPGIYTITNINDRKIYVGRSYDPYERLLEHKRQLKLGIHCNIHLQRAYNRDGKNNFEFEVLWECEEEFLVSEEHYWCTLLNVHSDSFGYNIAPTNPEQEHNVGALNSGAKSRKYETVYTYKLNGEFIEKIDDLYKYCKENELKLGPIKQAIRGVYTSSYSRQWKTEYVPSLPPVYRGKEKPVYQYDFDGNLLSQFKCVAEASNLTGIHYNYIRDCASGSTMKSKDYYFLFELIFPQEVVDHFKNRLIKNSKRIIGQYDLEGGLITYWNSLTEAGNTLKINRNKLTIYLKSGDPYKGFIWKYNN